MAISREDIVGYYEECDKHYSRFWDLDHSLAMRAGFWDRGVSTLRQALAREDEVLAEMAGIKTSDRVLDAGCGVGGSSIFLANRFGCRVTGISLSEKQIAQATIAAQERVRQAEMPRFEVRDFSKTGYPKESFDVVWAIESVCHAPCKKSFLSEAFRLLKPGGRLIVADGFSRGEALGKRDRGLMEAWARGWAVAELASSRAFRLELKRSGFEEVLERDMTEYVLPSSKKLFWISLKGLLFAGVQKRLGLLSPKLAANLSSAKYQWKTLRKNLWRYQIFCARKPSA